MNPPLEHFGINDIVQSAKSSFLQSKELFHDLRKKSGESIGDGEFLEKLHTIFCALDRTLFCAELFSNVHPDTACREALTKHEGGAKALATEIVMSRELYTRLLSVNQDALDIFTTRFVEKLLQEMKTSGAHLDEEVQKKIQTLQNEMTVLGQEFEKNIRDDVKRMSITEEELLGLPHDYILAHPPNKDGLVEITTNYPDYFPFMQYAKSAKRREQLELLFLTRAHPKNQSVLQTLLEKRKEFAKLLGFDTWAAYITSDKMVEHPDRVTAFLKSIQSFARVRAEAEMKDLTEFSMQHGHMGPLVSSDMMYYRNLFRKEKFGFDGAAIRTYFSYHAVEAGLFQLVEKLFELTIETRDIKAWHPSVRSFSVKNKEGKLMGMFYLDMFPREGKYGHAAQFTLVSGVKDLQVPEAALVCNFPDPEKHPEGLSLLGYDEVKTFFHEFGHLLHTICGGHTPFVTLSGVRTEWDFVEVPSQLFETWAASYEVLSQFAKKHDTREPISEELVEKLKQSQEWGKGLFATQQVYQSMVSLQYHLQDIPNLENGDLLKRLQETYTVIPFREGARFDLGFGHLTGYSAIYYTYLWSLALAKDVISLFEHDGLLDKTLAHRYRDIILGQGGAKPASVLLEEFLGRPHTFLAFETWLQK